MSYAMRLAADYGLRFRAGVIAPTGSRQISPALSRRYVDLVQATPRSIWARTSVSTSAAGLLGIPYLRLDAGFDIPVTRLADDPTLDTPLAHLGVGAGVPVLPWLVITRSLSRVWVLVAGCTCERIER